MKSTSKKNKLEIEDPEKNILDFLEWTAPREEAFDIILKIFEKYSELEGKIEIAN